MRITPKNWREFQHYKDRAPPWIRLHRKLLDNKDFNALPPIACKVLVLLWLVAADSTDGVFDDSAEDLAFRLRMPVKDVAQALAALKAKDFLVPADSEQESDDGVPLSKKIAERNGFGSRHISDKVKRAVWERDGGKCCWCESTESLEFDHKHPVSAGGNSELDNVQLLCRPCNRKKRAKTAEQVATPAQPWLDIRTTETETETEAEAETEAIQRQKAPAGAKGEYPQEFEDAWKAYPTRPGNSKADAFKAWGARIKEGAEAAEIIAGVKRYAAYCQANATEARFIKQAATFFGPSLHYQDTWEAASSAPAPVTVPSRAADETQRYLAERREQEQQATLPPPALMARINRAVKPTETA